MKHRDLIRFVEVHSVWKRTGIFSPRSALFGMLMPQVPGGKSVEVNGFCSTAVAGERLE